MNNFEQQVLGIYDWVVEGPTPLNDGSGFWNFGYWCRSTPNRRVACETLLERMLALIPDRAGNILDVACGTGETTRYLMKYYAPGDIVGIDVNAKQMSLCREQTPQCSFQEMSATEMTFADASFDNMLCVESAFHFKTREMFLNEAFRILKPGGRLVLSDLLLPQNTIAQPPENYLSSATDYKSLCHAAGFEDVILFESTEQCSAAFADYGTAFLQDHLRQGRISLADYGWQVGWLAHVRWLPYFLVSCFKA